MKSALFGKAAGVMSFVMLVLGVLASTEAVEWINSFMALVHVTPAVQQTVGQILTTCAGLYLLFTKALIDADKDGVPDIFEPKGKS